jgi:DNA-binding GntR family transcriptional regulator
VITLSRGARRQTTQALVLEEIHHRILEGHLKPGDRIVLDALSAELGVSPTPVREAMYALVAEGTVSLDPYRGFSIAELTPEEAEDLYETRAVLEALAARLAVPLFTDLLQQRLCQTVEAMAQAEADGNVAAYVRWDRTFHQTLYCASDRPVLQRQLTALMNRSVRYQYYQIERFGLPGVMQTSQRMHRRILDACERGDSRLVEELVREHISLSKSRVLRSLGAPAETATRVAPCRKTGSLLELEH